jgi:hypothetical protein
MMKKKPEMKKSFGAASFTFIIALPLHFLTDKTPFSQKK